MAEQADRLGYAVVWAAEAWGSDVVSVLGLLAARTSRIDIGSAIMQIPARTPAMTAMTAATLDTLSGGRFRLGLGVSGPQVSEGWHGVRFDKPLGRTREYVDIVRAALRRETLAVPGRALHAAAAGRPGQGAEADHPSGPRASAGLPGRGRAEEPRAGRRDRRRLAGRCSSPPSGPATTSTRCGAGRAKAGLSLDGFDVAPTVPVSIGPDPQACADPVRGYAALYLGGMGSREQNFYNQHRPPDGLRGRGRARSRTSTWTASSGRRPPPCRTSSSTAPRCSGRRSGSPTGWASWPRPGSPRSSSRRTGRRSRTGSSRCASSSARSSAPGLA